MFLVKTQPGRDPLRPSNKAARVLLVALASGFGLAVYWSTVVQLDVSASGTGRIVPSREIQVVQNLEGGIVEKTLVREGDHVTKNQIVARIADTDFNASYKEAQSNMAGYQAEIARLTAEVEGGAIHFPASVRTGFADLVVKEEKLHASRKVELESTLQSLRETVNRARNEAERARDSLPLLRQQLVLAREQKSIIGPQVQKGLISRVEELGIDQRILEIQGRISESERAIPAAAATAAEAESKISTERARFRSDALAHLMEAKVKLNGLTEILTAHKDRVSRREVRSPVNGIVKKLHISSVGEVVKPGASLLEIVPTDDTLLVEAKFSPKDIAFIHPGQPAYIRITAYDASIYGALTAEVTQVSADATVTDRDEVYYRLRAKATGSFQHADKALPLLPGMVAQVDVVTAKRSLFDYLVKPLTKLQYTALHER
ncbi:MAG: HlyD family type I secretion periplasmic adaptor subunit [Candidatus Sericytochromatia bacterium]